MRWFLLLSSLLSTACWASLSIEQLQTLTQAPSHLKGRFEQEKYLHGMGVTLSSSGVFDYRRGESIDWETQQPIHNQLRMTPSQITSHQGSNELLALDAASNPAVKIFSDILFSVLMAEWSQLSAYFELSGERVGEAGWQVVMTPLSSAVGQMVSRVELSGESLLQQVILFETNGDRTTIRFEPIDQ